ncbi:MAG: alpha/beta hydrolase [Amphritea sp.]|nr:alpha/beta hydrolase [Amphritea sp.]
MSAELLPCIEIEPNQPACASVIWMHGLGADGSDFEPVVPALELPESLPVRFVFPNAPHQPVTVNGGWVMPAWYDILEMNIERKIDVNGLLDSCRQIEALIAREIERGIPAERIVLAGFSQGGAVAYQTALCYPQRLAGLLTLSTYVATADLISADRSAANQDLPVLIAHGEHDDVVPMSLGTQAVNLLESMNYQPQWQTWPIDHSLCLEEVQAIGRWLQAVLRVE